MLRSFKKLAALALLVLCGQSSWGFALLGPNNEPYQTPDIGYNPLPRDGLPTAPKNIGEQYRRNTPVLYFSFDANFLDYFGSNGVVAVQGAFDIMNNLPKASKMSANLAEFPLEVTRENYLAEALGLRDLKSYALHHIIEQMGLAEPERYTWTLHDRYQFPNTTCPVGLEYLVIQRNFDPVVSPLNQFQSTPYVNGTLYTYIVTENCGQGGPPTAEAVEQAVDPLDITFTAVAAITSGFFNGASGLLTQGAFYTGLTRDDVGGLRYLLSTNLVAFESAGPTTLAEVTNPVPQLLFTSNLTELASAALTNNAAALGNLFPNLNIISSSNYFVNVLVTNVTAFFTNEPWSPAGTTTLEFSTNIVPTIQSRFVHTFGNLLLLHQTGNGPTLVPITRLPGPNGQSIVTIETDKIGTIAPPFSPVGTIIFGTNSTFTTFLTNTVVGDYVLLPTNWCSVDILSHQLTFVTQATNLLGSATNTLPITNPLGFTNAGNTLFIRQSLITYYTNQAFVVLPVLCFSNNVSLLQGVDQIKFVRRDYDSLVGRFFTPFTNFYVLNSVTNNTLIPQRAQRLVTIPDFLMSATDLAPSGGAIPTYFIVSRSINFNTNFENVGLAGPGTIEPFTTVPNTMAFNKVGVIQASFSSFFGNDVGQGEWGSFDGTTNAPIVYPNGTSIVNLENQVLIGISPAHLATGQVGVNYGSGPNKAFSATGGVAPYSWSLAPDSPGLPPGLFLSSNGTISGTPTSDGTFDFTIRLTDAAGRTVDRSYSLTIF